MCQRNKCAMEHLFGRCNQITRKSFEGTSLTRYLTWIVRYLVNQTRSLVDLIFPLWSCPLCPSGDPPFLSGARRKGKGREGCSCAVAWSGRYRLRACRPGFYNKITIQVPSRNKVPFHQADLGLRPFGKVLFSSEGVEGYATGSRWQWKTHQLLALYTTPWMGPLLSLGEGLPGHSSVTSIPGHWSSLSGPSPD